MQQAAGRRAAERVGQSGLGELRQSVSRPIDAQRRGEVRVDVHEGASRGGRVLRPVAEPVQGLVRLFLLGDEGQPGDELPVPRPVGGGQFRRAHVQKGVPGGVGPVGGRRLQQGPHPLVRQQCRGQADDGGVHVPVDARGTAHGGQERGGDARGQMAGGEPGGRLPDGDLHLGLAGQDVMEQGGDPGGPGVGRGAGGRGPGGRRPVVSRVVEEGGEGRGRVVGVGGRVQSRRRQGRPRRAGRGLGRTPVPGDTRARSGVPLEQGPAVLRHRGHRTEQRRAFVEAPAGVGDDGRGQPDRGLLLPGQPPVGVTERGQRPGSAGHGEPAALRGRLGQGAVQQVGPVRGEDGQHLGHEGRGRVPRQQLGHAFAPGRRVGQPGGGDLAEDSVRAGAQGLSETVLEVRVPEGVASGGPDQREQRRDVSGGGCPVQQRPERAQHGARCTATQQGARKSEPHRSGVRGQGFDEVYGGPQGGGTVGAVRCVRGGFAAVGGARFGAGEERHGQRPDRVPGPVRAVPGPQTVEAQPFHGGGPGATPGGRADREGCHERRGRKVADGGEGFLAHGVALVGESGGGQREDLGDLPRITGVAGVGDQLGPDRPALVGVMGPESGQQLGAGLGRRQQGEETPEVPARGGLGAERLDRGAGPGVPLGGRQRGDHPRVRVDVPARTRGDDGVHETGPARRWHRSQQHAEGLPVEPPGPQEGQRRRVRRHQLPHDGSAGGPFPPRGRPVRLGEPAHDALGVDRDEVAQPVLHRTGQVVGAVPLQQVEDAPRRGGQGGGDSGGVPPPPEVAQPPGYASEFPLRMVQDGGGMAYGQRAPVLERERRGEFGQQPCGELRRAARQQAGRVPVAVRVAHPEHQPLGEFRPPPVTEQPRQVGADHGGRVVVGRLDGGVRDGQPPGAAQRVPADHGVRVAEPGHEVVRLSGGQGRERGEAAFVRAARGQSGEQRPYRSPGGEPVSGDGGQPEPGGVRQGFEGGEQLLGSGDHRGHCA
ncbi:hypothetical protein STANM309S_02852 [Streptomyces tanashiensis]